MYITVSQLANAINKKQHIKPEDIIKVITVMVINHNSIHYQVIDRTWNISYYSEDTVPVSVVKLMNYNRPVKTWTREDNNGLKEYYQYRF